MHPEPTAADAPPAQPAGTVLVVDDNEMNRDMLSRRLIRAGFEVVIAEDGPGALDLVEARGVSGPSPSGGAALDLVLLDVMMPGIDGFEVLRRIRQRRSRTDLPVIMATAKDQREDIVQALSLGANDYVTKPLDFPIVLARVQTQLALKRGVDHILHLERNLERRNVELDRANQRMRRELELAAKVQRTLLPTQLPSAPGARFAWAYRPCEELAGDILNIFAVGEGHVAMYLLDVSGHGVPSALLSVTLSRLLAPVPGQPSLVVQRTRDGVEAPTPPGQVVAELNRRFLMDPDTLQYFTLFYGVLDHRRGELRYVCAGHPPPIHIPRSGPPATLDGKGFPVGWFADAQFDEFSHTLAAGDRLILHSDGISEAVNVGRDHFGLPRVLAALDRSRQDPIDQCLESLVREAHAWACERFSDDVSAVAVEAL